jgi:hypothetical protein
VTLTWSRDAITLPSLSRRFWIGRVRTCASAAKARANSNAVRTHGQSPSRSSPNPACNRSPGESRDFPFHEQAAASAPVAQKSNASASARPAEEAAAGH